MTFQDIAEQALQDLGSALSTSLPVGLLLLFLLAVALLGYLLGRSHAGWYWQKEMADREDSIRTDAVARSRAVRRGQSLEQLAPFLSGFEYHPADVRFLGSPVDLVVFDGLEEKRSPSIVFVEIKTGRAALTQRERLVRGAVEEGRVEWRTLRIDADSGVIGPAR